MQAVDVQALSTGAVFDMHRRSEHLCALAGGVAPMQRMLDVIEDIWLEHDGLSLHCELHPVHGQAKAIIVFQPGSGAHARLYFLLGGLLARHGYRLLAIDRPGHGLSGGTRGDGTIGEAIAVTQCVVEHARGRFDLPVVLMGSSLGGLLTVFALLRGLRPDLAVAHNFVYPGKLLSMRLRARWIARHRHRPYPLTELVHDFERLSDDPAVVNYLRERSDPGAAWALSVRSVASLFAFRAPAPAEAPPTLVLTGSADKAIPSWATRFFMGWSGLPGYEVQVLRGAGHLLFHDHLDMTLPILVAWLDEKLAGMSGDAETTRPTPTRSGA